MVRRRGERRERGEKGEGREGREGTREGRGERGERGETNGKVVGRGRGPSLPSLLILLPAKIYSLLTDPAHSPALSALRLVTKIVATSASAIPTRSQGVRVWGRK